MSSPTIISASSSAIAGMALDYRAFIRKRLQKTSVELPDADIDMEYSLVVTELYLAYPCTNPYTSLSASEQIVFEKAAALKTALILHRQSVATGALKSIEQGPIKTEYATGGAGLSGAALDAAWGMELQNLLFLIGCIGPAAFEDFSTQMQSVLPLSNLPNANDPSDSRWPADVARMAEVA